MKELNAETFQAFIQSEQKVLVDFYGPACPACEALRPYLERVSVDYPNRIAKVNASEEMEIALEFGIRQIPTMLVFQNNVLIARRIGSVKSVEIIHELIA
jgi:thioredoxin 1